MSILSGGKRLSANARAAVGLVKFLGLLFIGLGVLYSDVMFVSLMQGAFPQGWMAAGAYAGAFITGGSIIALVVGKSYWFRPGGQVYAAWAFTVAEVAVSILNVLVSVQTARHADLGSLSVWLLWAPATPFVSVVGWMVIHFLDPERATRHREMEMEDEVKIAEIEHQENVHIARLGVKAISLQYQQQYLAQHLASPQFQQEISEGAREIVANTIAELTGKPARPVYSPPALPAGKEVEADKVYSPYGTNKNAPAPAAKKDAVHKPFLATPQPASPKKRLKRLPRLRRKSVLARVALAQEDEKTQTP